MLTIFCYRMETVASNRGESSRSGDKYTFWLKYIPPVGKLEKEGGGSTTTPGERGVTKVAARHTHTHTRTLVI